MATNIIVPHLGESIESATLTHWYRQVGDTVTRGEEIADLETDKATLSIECPKKGSLLAVLVEPGSEVHIGQLLAVIGEPGEKWHEESITPKHEDRATSQIIPAPDSKVVESPATRRRRQVSPLARRRAQALGINVDLVTPAKGNRVKAADVEKFAVLNAQSVIVDGTEIPGHRVPISGLKKLVGQRMLKSVQTAPHFSVTVKVDARRLMAVRDEWEKKGQPVSMTAMLVYFVARSLPSHPLINSRFDDDHILVFDTFNIGVAVATTDGLRVPVLQRAETLRLAAIDTQLKAVVEKARLGKLSADDIADGTFTISNLGMMGVSQFSPILNPPQAAILGVGAPFSVFMPAEGGDMRLAHIMELTLTSDHRVLDGADAARFLATLKENLETCVID
jgi:pyruvate dehydrogenase E2 component (dihydrolipoamide acetyltransferase)